LQDTFPECLAWEYAINRDAAGGTHGFLDPGDPPSEPAPEPRRLVGLIAEASRARTSLVKDSQRWYNPRRMERRAGKYTIAGSGVQPSHGLQTGYATEPWLALLALQRQDQGAAPWVAQRAQAGRKDRCDCPPPARPGQHPNPHAHRPGVQLASLFRKSMSRLSLVQTGAPSR
jgi:hypothetical protein